MKRKRLLGGLLALLMLLNIGSAFPVFGNTITGEGGAGKLSSVDLLYGDVTDWLKDLITLTITQGGSPIGEGGQLDPTKNFRVQGIFSDIPLTADSGGPYLAKGNYAIFPIADDVKLVDPGATVHELKDSAGKKIGTVKFQSGGSGLEARIDFEDLWADDTYIAIENARFNADLRYAGDATGDEEIDKVVIILGKSFRIFKAAVPTEPIIGKTGSLNESTGIITWTVTANAKKGAVPDKSLEGIKFTDTLPAGVTYVPNSFTVGGASRPDSAVVKAVNKLEYIFLAGDGDGPKDIVYQTQIDNWETVKYGFTAHTFKNSATAELYGYKPTASHTITIDQKEWINKVGEKSSDPLTDEITWYIQVNMGRYNLTGLTITDQLSSGLTFKSGQWQRNTAAPGAPATWVDEGSSITSAPSDHKYIYKNDINATTSDHLRLIIVTTADIESGGYISDPKIYTNTATVDWTGKPGGPVGLPGPAPGITLGFHALNKDGNFDSNWQQNHLINWTLTLNFNNQFPGGLADFTVYDLLVHGKSPSDKGVKPEDSIITSAVWNSLTPQYGQKYNGPISATTGLYVTNTEVKNAAGHYVADLLKISNFSDDGKTYTVKFSSKMLDASEFTKNTSSDNKVKVMNTATLFDKEAKRKDATKTLTRDVKVLEKAVLAATADEDSLTGATGLGNASNGFNHINKTAVFRLNINKDGQNLSDPEFLGRTPITVTDTLPVGWEFDQTYNGNKGYKIFAGATASLAAPDPVTTLVFSESGGKKTASFTFDELNQHYVILVKARLTDEAYAKLIEENSPTDIIQTNSASLSGNGKTVTVSTDVTIKTGEVSKDSTRLKDGVAQWKITYNPLEVEAVAVQDQVFIKDTLNSGFELYLDSDLKPDTTNEGTTPRFSIKEMELKLDGTLEETGGNLAPDWIAEGKVTYDVSNRRLNIEVADKTKAYLVSYLTILTGAPTKPVTNNVVVEGIKMKKTSDDGTFLIEDSDAFASLRLGGYLRIKKVDKNNAVISSPARFTLSTSEGRVIREGDTDSGILRFGALSPNTLANPYILKEITAPGGGYLLNNKEYRVVVTGSGENITTNIYDELDIIVATFTASSAADATFNVINWKADDPARPKYGDLTISKTASGTLLDTLSKEYDFKLYFTDSDGPHSGKYICLYSDSSSDIIDIPASGIYDLKLSHGQSVTIKNLLASTKVTITEKTQADEYIKTTYQIDDGNIKPSTSADVTIPAEDTKTVSFFNDRQSGSLTLKKTAIGFFPGDDPKPFKFDLSLTEKDGTTPLEGTYSYSINGGSSSFSTNASGTTSLALEDTDYITISDLPEDTKFFITETSGTDKFTVTTYEINNPGGTNRDGTGISTKANTSAPATDGITVGAETLVTFKNVRNTGDLMIAKEALGYYPKSASDPDEDENKLFSFNLILKDGLNPLEGSYTYYYKNDLTKRSLSSNTLDFNLTANDYIVIEKLPENVSFIITEAPIDEYTVTTHKIHGTSHSGGNTANGTLPETGSTVIFTNTRETGDLTLTKTVVGNLRDPNQKFKFTLNFTEIDGTTTTPHKGTYNYTANGTGDNIIISDSSISLPASDNITIDGILTIELEKDQSITIHDLPKDIEYTITEEDYSTDRITTAHSIDGGSEISGREVSGPIKARPLDTKITFKNTRRSGTIPTDPWTPTQPTTTPSEPTETTGPSEGPTEPTESTEPTDTTGPTEPTETTAPTEPTYPTIPTENVPDPNNPDSPDDFILIDENGTPQGRYTKAPQPDGSFVYLDENGIPLGQRPIPRTGDQSNLILWAIVLTLSLAGAGWLLLPQFSLGRRKH